MTARREVWVKTLFGLFGFGLFGFGAGLLVAHSFPVALWPTLLGLLALWLARWPRRQEWLVALLLGGLLASPLRSSPEPVGGGVRVRNYVSTAAQAQAWAGVRTAVVRNSDGPITALGGGLPRLRASYRWTGAAGATPQGVPDDLLTDFAARRLSVTGLEPGWPSAARRGVEAELHVEVPRHSRLVVSGRRGDVTAHGLASVHIDTNLGDVALSDIAGAVVALTDIGNVLITDAGAGVEAQTQVGDIWLEPSVSTAPVLAKADVGDIALVLPRDADVRVQATSVSKGLPKAMTRLSPTQAELVLGRGTQLIVLTTRVGEISIVQP